MKENLEDGGSGRQNKREIGRAYLLGGSIVISVMLIGVTFAYTAGRAHPPERNTAVLHAGSNTQDDGNTGISADGAVLPVTWGDLGAQMVRAGVIDRKKFESIYASRGGSTEELEALLLGEGNGAMKITDKNAGIMLNFLWALGLGNKNRVLQDGPMADPRYGGAGNFASTGGWTLASGNTMNHYGAHRFIELSPEQQDLVERVAKNIYRPCCNNSTYFPDCNHGMAMLGFLELAASQGVSEEEMYRSALILNRYWFPDTYDTIARYLEAKGLAFDSMPPKEILGAAFSSGSGYQRILEETVPVERRNGGSCGV